MSSLPEIDHLTLALGLMTSERDALLAENQRLREALIAMRELESVNEDTWYGEHAGIDRYAVYALAREALAGDAE